MDRYITKLFFYFIGYLRVVRRKVVRTFQSDSIGIPGIIYMNANKGYAKPTHGSRRVESTVLTLCPLDAITMENQCEIKVTCSPSASAHTHTHICIKMSRTGRTRQALDSCVCVRRCVCAKNKQCLIFDTWPFAFDIEFVAPVAFHMLVNSLAKSAMHLPGTGPGAGRRSCSLIAIRSTAATP